MHSDAESEVGSQVYDASTLLSYVFCSTSHFWVKLLSNRPRADQKLARAITLLCQCANTPTQITALPARVVCTELYLNFDGVKQMGIVLTGSCCAYRRMRDCTSEYCYVLWHPRVSEVNVMCQHNVPFFETWFCSQGE